VRYKFHEQKALIEKNPKHVLPADINAPVLAFLERIGCKGGVEVLLRWQASIAYGSMDLIREDAPNAKITISTEAGMAEGWKEYEALKIGPWAIIKYKTVKNANLDKRRPKETPK
jgi:hypothetical protein